MKLLIVLVFISATLEVAYTKDINNISLKIISYPCHDKDRLKQGSGVIFRKQDKAFVITSEHIVFHDKSYCFQASSKKYQNLKLKLIDSDWASGLSLLEVQDYRVNLDDLLDLSDFKRPRKNTMVISTGFPLGKEFKITSKARVIDTDSKEQQFLSGTVIIKIDTFEAVYGMSGGGVFEMNDNFLQLVGINAHIYNKSLLAISGEDAKDWIIDTLQETRRKSVTVNDIDQDRRLINFSGIQLVESRVARLEKNGWMVSNGGDPVGIGGSEENNRENNRPIEIALYLKDFYGTPLNQIPLMYHDMIKKLKIKLMKKNKITISCFYNNGILYPILSSQQFAKYLSIGYIPKIRSENIFIKSDEAELFKLAKSLKQMIGQLTLFNDKIKINSRLTTLVDIINSDSWDMLPESDFDLLLDDVDYWNGLYHNDNTFDLAIDIKSSLIAYKKIRNVFVIDF